MMHPVAFKADENSNILQRLVFQNITNPLTQNICANVLIFIHALIINQIFIKHKFSKEITIFAGLFYILYSSLITDNNLLSNVLIANTFIILSVKYILDTYKTTQSVAFIFNAGFLIGFSTLFYSPYFAFIPFGIIALIQLRSFKIKEKLQFLIGVFVPYFILFTYRYWEDIDFVDLDFVKDMFFRLPSLKLDGYIVFYASVAIILLCVLMTLFNYGNYISKKSIQSQKKIDIVYWVMLFCLISYLIFNSIDTSHLITLAFPLSILIGISVSDSKNKLFFELFHILIVSLIFINQFNLIQF